MLTFAKMHLLRVPQPVKSILMKVSLGLLGNENI